MRTYIFYVYNKIDVCISEIIRLRSYLDVFLLFFFLQNHPPCQGQFNPIEIFNPTCRKKVTDL